MLDQEKPCYAFSMVIPLKCACGKLQGQVELSRFLNQRLVCLCNDCQAYAHYLDRVDKMLDRNGGTEIIPVHPSKIRLTRGTENLACVRLSDDGIYRWYAGCCKTPIANTPRGGRIPYAGVVSEILDFGIEERRRESVLGPILARINGKYGIPPLPSGTAQNTPIRVILRVLVFLGVGYLKKLGAPSPFTDPSTGKAVLKPKVLSDSEYYALIDRCGPPRVNARPA